MSRNLDTTLASHLGDAVIVPVVLAQLTFRSGTTYCWTGPGPLAWNGNTFLGIGSMGKVGAISEGVDVQAQGTSVGLSGIDPALKASCLGDIRLGAPARLWLGLYDIAAGGLLGTPYAIFSGSVDKPAFQIGGAAVDITLALESRMVNLSRASNRRYTAADQHLSYPNDTGFVWMEIENDISLDWG